MPDYEDSIAGVSDAVRSEALELLRHYPYTVDLMDPGSFDTETAKRLCMLDFARKAKDGKKRPERA